MRQQWTVGTVSLLLLTIIAIAGFAMGCDNQEPQYDSEYGPAAPPQMPPAQAQPAEPQGQPAEPQAQPAEPQPAQPQDQEGTGQQDADQRDMQRPPAGWPAQ